jgi:hypothetical protein
MSLDHNAAYERFEWLDSAAAEVALERTQEHAMFGQGCSEAFLADAATLCELRPEKFTMRDVRHWNAELLAYELAQVAMEDDHETSQT